MEEDIEMERQKHKPHKNTWNEEMKDVFNESGEIVTTRLNEPHLYRFWDVNQKFLYLMNNMLVATPRNTSMPEQFMTVLPNNALDPKELPIFMGLRTGRPTLSCVKSGAGQLQLQLVERDIMDLYKKNEQLRSFTFYSKTEGGKGTCSFESAEFRGWYLSTSSEPNKPLGLSREGQTENTVFYFEKTQK